MTILDNIYTILAIVNDKGETIENAYIRLNDLRISQQLGNNIAITLQISESDKFQICDIKTIILPLEAGTTMDNATVDGLIKSIGATKLG